MAAAASTPLLSVFIPTYNSAQYVREALASVLDNGFGDLEVVVVDDASTDETAQIVEAIRHPALRFYRNPENLGVAASRARSVALLRGKYVALLDGDDIALPGRFEKQVSRLEEKDGPDILGGGVERFGEIAGRELYMMTDAQIAAAMLFNSPLSNPTVCMRLAPFRDGRIRYRVEAGLAADYALWADAMLTGLRLENLPVLLTRYRQHGASLTRTASDQADDQARSIRLKVAESYFPAMTAVEHAILADTLSRDLNAGPEWRDGVYALSHAATLAGGVPRIDTALMIEVLEAYLVSMIGYAIKLGTVSNDTLEEMTDENEHFERWRAASNGALDARIMALIR